MTLFWGSIDEWGVFTRESANVKGETE